MNLKKIYNHYIICLTLEKKTTTKSVTKSRKPSTEEQRERWRESKKRQKAKKIKHLHEDDVDYFTFNPMDEEDQTIDIQEPQSIYITPP